MARAADDPSPPVGPLADASIDVPIASLAGIDASVEVDAAAGSGARAKRPVPTRSPRFDHLALDELRAYRDELADEETQVSYWRRVLQARIDHADASTSSDLVDAALRRGLRMERLTSGRATLLRLVPGQRLPPLPDLDWLPREGSFDDELAPGLLVQLVAAEVQLSAYRASLHECIDSATYELIARYRESPSLAVRALPLTPPTRSRGSGP